MARDIHFSSILQRWVLIFRYRDEKDAGKIKLDFMGGATNKSHNTNGEAWKMWSYLVVPPLILH
jgi:hypothetical protein